jgi:hypothetical protein
MAQGQYCIVDLTINGDLALEGLTGLTLEAAEAWLAENQVSVEEFAVTEGVSTSKFAIQPDNWVDESDLV